MILLGIAELVSTIPTGVCKPTVSGSCPTNTPYTELSIILIVLGVISLFLSKFEHSSSPENDAQEKSPDYEAEPSTTASLRIPVNPNRSLKVYPQFAQMNRRVIPDLLA